MAEDTSEDFLYSPPVDHLDYAHPAEPDGARRRRLPVVAVTAAWLAVGLVVGVIAVAVLHSGRAASANGLPAAATGNQQQLPPGQGFPGPGFGGPGGGGPGGRSGFGGEQHVVGTLSTVGSSSITVRAAGTTTTYRIDATTQLVKDGQPVSSLAAMHVGDRVLVHVYTINGTTHVERVIDGMPPGFGGGDAGTNSGAGTTNT